jgi:DUF971 family protein
MKPKQIKVIEKVKLFLKWENDSETYIQLKYLRDECPCASCKGETVLLRTYKPAKQTLASPESYMIKSIQQVGGYAIQIYWGDGHNTGIYTWDYLNQLSEDQQDGTAHDYNKII